MKYIVNNSTDPRYNLALEEYAFKNLNLMDDYIILWRNVPSIIIGRNQCIFEEVNYQYVTEKNIDVVRRISGGGAVYHDLGNLNFSLITRVDKMERIDYKKYLDIIINSLDKLGIKCKLSERNDITLDGKKISGVAQSISRGRLLNHGTLLYNSNLDALSKSLYIKKGKIETKAAKSVQSKVANINDYLKSNMDILEFRDLLVKYIFEYKKSPMLKYELTKEDKTLIDSLIQNKYNTWEWNYSKSPKFHYENSKEFDDILLNARINVEDGLIKECKLYGNISGTKNVRGFEESLIGLKYERNEIINHIKNIDITKYFGEVSKDDLLSILF
jgi:lipoate-protein ligase A